MLHLTAHSSMLQVGLVVGQAIFQGGRLKQVFPMPRVLSGLFDGLRVVCGLGNPRRSPDHIRRSLRCGQVCETAGFCETAGLGATWTGGLAGALADIFKLWQTPSNAGFCSGMPACAMRLECWQGYDNFESCNVNNLQSCLVWICLSIRSEL